MPALRLDHAAVTVADTETAVHFYVGLLGLRKVEQHELAGDALGRVFGIPVSGGKSTRLQAGEDGPLIDLMEVRGVPDSAGKAKRIGSVGSSHLAFSVPDVHEEFNRLREAGVEILSEPVSFALENGDVTTVCFLRDPDGNYVEIESTVNAR